jgi:menaquinone-dependent protoporphyrinogen oxidase
MDRKALVVYVSKRGSTAEIAERIGETLRQNGWLADVSDAVTVNDLSPYSTIILGSSVYMGRWHKEAVAFLKKNIESLDKLPVWLYVSGPTGQGNPMEQMDGRLYPQSLQPLIKRLNPKAIVCFGGKLAPEKLNPFERWIVRIVKSPAGDFRNWEDIRHWAETIR